MGMEEKKVLFTELDIQVIGMMQTQIHKRLLLRHART